MPIESIVMYISSHSRSRTPRGPRTWGCVPAVLPIILVVGLLNSPPCLGGNIDARESTLAKESIFVPGERPFDAVNIFGDFGRSVRSPDDHKAKLWWERMARGEVGRDRFLILCALKDGGWKKLANIRDFIEFQTHENFSADKLQAVLFLMAVKRRVWQANSTWTMKPGEGWLERNRQANFSGIESEWRIEPSVLPLLYFLLMSCPEENRCQ